MSAAANTLRRAAVAGVRVRVDGGSLVLDALTKPPADLVAALQRYKAEIVRLLTAAEPATTPAWNGVRAVEPTDGDRAAWALWADARDRLTRYPPDDVTPRQWDQLRDDFERFCVNWAADATMLGWTPADVLGWDPSRAHYSPICKHLGLCWRFDGRAVVEMRRDYLVLSRGGIREKLLRHTLY